MEIALGMLVSREKNEVGRIIVGTENGGASWIRRKVGMAKIGIEKIMADVELWRESRWTRSIVIKKRNIIREE